jgi:formylglycine-generating enzyme required for sulfatase activity
MAFLFCLALCSARPAEAMTRLALVIGNAAYANSPLANPVNDARDMAAKLTSLGFVVMKAENLKRRQIGPLLRSFASRIEPGDQVVVFYAGHGLQVKGVNYFPAVDAEIQGEDDVALNSLNLNALMEKLDEAKAGVKLFFLDACRNNPFSRSFRGGNRGLAPIDIAPSGTLIHFATRPGSVAGDGSGRNGLYTEQMLKLIDSRDMAVESMLKRVAAAVERASDGAQEPWMEGSLKGDFYFNASSQQTAKDPGTGAGGNTAQSGAGIAVSATPPRKPKPTDVPATPPAPVPSTSVATLARSSAPPAAPGPSVKANPGKIVKDCAICPELVTVPGGSFVMGTPVGEKDRDSDEGPQHTVHLASFLLGRTEVTQGQWRAVMGGNPSNFTDCGDDCPVETVSWEDAQEYARKLSASTGKAYRLPTEAEWEYAARAGTATSFPWGPKGSHDQANYGRDECCEGLIAGKDKWLNTAPVAQFPANAFGLYDMLGNVWEWVEDVHHRDYKGAPADGSAWTTGAERSQRVLRGGAWAFNSAYLRVGNRYKAALSDRVYFIGFRVARAL